MQALRAAHRRAARLVGLCPSDYPVAATGLLDGRSATTHWSVADHFAQRFPSVRVDRDLQYVDEGDVVTSAGTTAGMDRCLHLWRQLRGVEAANRVARHLVVAPHGAGGQAQSIDRPVPVVAADSYLARTLEQVIRDVAALHSVDSVAAMAVMSRRSFTRRFRQTCGASPMAWLAAQRLTPAQRLLEQTELSIDSLAEAVGIVTAAALRQHFRQLVGVSPSAWLKGFRYSRQR